MLIRVVLPAPLGPSRPKNSPSSMSKLTSSSALRPACLGRCWREADRSWRPTGRRSRAWEPAILRRGRALCRPRPQALGLRARPAAARATPYSAASSRRRGGRPLTAKVLPERAAPRAGIPAAPPAPTNRTWPARWHRPPSTGSGCAAQPLQRACGTQAAASSCVSSAGRTSMAISPQLLPALVLLRCGQRGDQAVDALGC